MNGDGPNIVMISGTDKLQFMRSRFDQIEESGTCPFEYLIDID